MHKVFYSPDYCLASHSSETTRKASWLARMLTATPLAELVEPQPVSIETVMETHTEEYVRAVEAGEPLSLAMSQGFAWCPELLPSVLSSTGGVVAAALSAMEDGVAGTLSSGLHHARAAAGLGFCTFNGLVIAAKEAIKRGAESVLILDLDAHGGGGTQSLISSNVRITHLDVCVDPFDVDDSCTVDMSRRSPGDYLTVIDAVLRGLKPDLCIYNAGMDVHEGDCGPAGFDHRVIAARESIVFGWADERRVPIAYTMAGGYTSPTVSRERLLAHHMMTIRTAAHFSNARALA